jgi:hypothetical protein
MAETWEQERDAIIRLIGECITTWSMVERGLTLLYCECVGSPVGSPDLWLHASIFDSVISIDARLAMVQTALLGGVRRLTRPRSEPVPYLSEWKELRKKIRKKYDKRNEVAHSDITQRGMEDGSQMVRLLAFPTLTTGALGVNQTLLSIGQLRDRIKEFEKLSGEISAFRDQVRASLARPPKSP